MNLVSKATFKIAGGPGGSVGPQASQTLDAIESYKRMYFRLSRLARYAVLCLFTSLERSIIKILYGIYI